MEIRFTERGFAIIEFKDEYGKDCSLQKSSLATDDCVWLGVNDADPQILISGEGWRPLPLPKGEIAFHTRMHLTREMVKELLPHLQKFIDIGEI